MEINGVPVRELTLNSGTAWRWEPQPGIEFEIMWVEETRHFTSGAKYGDGGWKQQPIRTPTLDQAADVDDARDRVVSHLERTPWLGA